MAFGIRRKIDRIVEDLIVRRYVDHHKATLKEIGPKAVPALLAHLDTDDPRRRKVAMFGLQYCYAKEVLDRVAELLKHDDDEVRDCAAIVIGRNEGMRRLADLCKPLLDDPRSDVAAFALTYVEGEFPDAERTRRALADPEIRETLWKYLPRYYTNSFTPVTRELLGHERAEVGWSACITLIQQCDRSLETRREIEGMLALPVAETREVAAEYLTWHGSKDSIPFLRTALSDERDLHARAAIEAAIPVIEARCSTADEAHITGETDGTVSTRFSDRELCTRYRDAIRELEADGNAKACRNAFEVFRSSEAFEPRWEYRGDGAKGAFAEARTLRLALQSKLFAVPGWTGEAERFWDEIDYPTATNLVPPVGEYFDDKRTSYGRRMESHVDAFGNMVHMGDDVHWYKDLRTVVAAAPGVVRMAGYQPTWGYVVVLEHATPYFERMCSLYAHLGAFLHVRPGQIVAQGQKLGVIGRSYTWENGGYAAHVHFALHNGPFRQSHRPGTYIDVKYKDRFYKGKVLHSDYEQTLSRIKTSSGSLEILSPTTWVAGYICMAGWQEHRHRWMDPQISVRINLRGHSDVGDWVRQGGRKR